MRVKAIIGPKGRRSLVAAVLILVACGITVRVLSKQRSATPSGTQADTSRHRPAWWETVEGQKRYVLDRLEAIEGRSGSERAKIIWRLWVRVVAENWSEDWWHEEVLIAALRETGDAGMQVLLEELQCPKGVGASEAARFLGCFHPEALYELISLLANDSESVQHIALVALWHCPTSRLNRDEHRALRDAVEPFVGHASARVREKAQWIIRDLDYYPPTPPEEGSEAE